MNAGIIGEDCFLFSSALLFVPLTSIFSMSSVMAAVLSPFACGGMSAFGEGEGLVEGVWICTEAEVVLELDREWTFPVVLSGRTPKGLCI